MTNFSATFKALWWPKFRIANWILGLYGLMVVASVGLTGFSEGWGKVDLANSTMGVGFGLGTVVFIWLAFHTEHDLTRDSYRLLPVTDTRLYLTSLLTSFVAFGYFVAVKALVMGLGFLAGHASDLHGVLVQVWQGGQAAMGERHFFEMVLYTTLFIVVLIVWMWVMITLIHLLTTALSAVLPNVQQRIVRFILAVVVIVALIWMGKWLLQLAGPIVSGVSNNAAIALSLGILTAVTAVMVAVNVYLLQHWVEARY